MGNNQNKLEKKASSLPPQNFPAPPCEDSSFIRKLVRASKRKKHGETAYGKRAGAKGEDAGAWSVPFTDGLFLPEYPMMPPGLAKTEKDIGEFKVKDVIARGAFGNVLRVKRRADGTVYAMKIMKKAQVIVEGAVRQCKDEATIQNAVGHHPFIVKPYFFFQTKESVFIVMDYVPRGELFAAWRHFSHFNEGLVKIYIAELALVIDFLHRAEIIYRDLKMENILIDLQGHLQVIDFGLAKWLKRGARTRTICGTLQYIAPEVLSMQPYGHSADWWSLGVLMHALLIGDYPVTGAMNHFEMAHMVHNHKYDLPAECPVSEDCRDCLFKLLEPDPKERICDIQTLQREPFFHDIDFECLVNREFSPSDYFESQDYLRDRSMSRTSSMGTSIDGGLNRSNRSRHSRIKMAWNESVASLNASFV